MSTRWPWPKQFLLSNGERPQAARRLGDEGSWGARVGNTHKVSGRLDWKGEEREVVS